MIYISDSLEIDRYIFPCRTLEMCRAMEACVSGTSTIINRFRTRRDAERALEDILTDGGRPEEFRIEEDADGTCLIVILEQDGGEIAGMLGA